MFQSDLVQLAIATVFLLLTAFLTWDLLFVTRFTPFYLAGLFVVVLLVLVVRPLAVMISTIRSKFTTREKLFMSFFGPRGIVIAATGIFMSITLSIRHAFPFPQLPDYISPVVLLTVIIQTGLAPFTAKACGVCTIEYDKKQ